MLYAAVSIPLLIAVLNMNVVYATSGKFIRVLEYKIHGYEAL